MRGQQTVLDSSNLDAVIADAIGGEPEVELPKDSGKPPEPEAKPEKVEAKPEAEEVDDETGLTAEEKQGLTAKMLKAIGKKHRGLKESEEFAAAQYNERRLAEQRAEVLERELNRLKAQNQPAAKVEDTKPDRQNFKTDDEYQTALIDYRVEQKIRDRDTQQAQQREQERIQQVTAEAGARLAKARELVDDFTETVAGADIEVPAHIGAYMQESEMIAELGYHFAKHPETLERLQKMTPHKALVEIGKIESTLKPFGPADNAKPEKVAEKKDAPVATAKTASEPSQSKPRAAAPITPLNTGSDSQVEKSPRDRTYAEERAAFQRDKGVNLLKRQRH